MGCVEGLGLLGCFLNCFKVFIIDQDGFFKLCMRSMKNEENYPSLLKIAKSLVSQYMDTEEIRS